MLEKKRVFENPLPQLPQFVEGDVQTVLGELGYTVIEDAELTSQIENLIAESFYFQRDPKIGLESINFEILKQEDEVVVAFIFPEGLVLTKPELGALPTIFPKKKIGFSVKTMLLANDDHSVHCAFGSDIFPRPIPCLMTLGDVGAILDKNDPTRPTVLIQAQTNEQGLTDLPDLFFEMLHEYGHEAVRPYEEGRAIFGTFTKERNANATLLWFLKKVNPSFKAQHFSDFDLVAARRWVEDQLQGYDQTSDAHKSLAQRIEGLPQLDPRLRPTITGSKAHSARYRGILRRLRSLPVENWDTVLPDILKKK